MYAILINMLFPRLPLAQQAKQLVNTSVQWQCAKYLLLYSFGSLGPGVVPDCPAKWRTYTLISPKVNSQSSSSAFAHSLKAIATINSTIDSALPMIEKKWRSREGLS